MLESLQQIVTADTNLWLIPQVIMKSINWHGVDLMPFKVQAQQRNLAVR